MRSQSTYSMGKVDGLLIHWHENGQKKNNIHLKMASSPHVQNHGTMKVPIEKKLEKFFVSYFKF